MGELITKGVAEGGKTVNLKMKAPNTKNFLNNLSWDTPDYDDGGDQSIQWDADFGTFFSDADGNVLGALTYLNNGTYNYHYFPNPNDVAASRSADETTGKLPGVDEFGIYDTEALERLAPAAVRATTFVHLYAGSQRFTDPSRSVKGQTFAGCKNLKSELLDADSGVNILTVLPGTEFAGEWGLVIGAMVKTPVGWSYEPILQALSRDYITYMARDYGLKLPAGWPEH